MKQGNLTVKFNEGYSGQVKRRVTNQVRNFDVCSWSEKDGAAKGLAVGGGAFGETRAWMAMETVVHTTATDSYSTARQKSWVAA